MNSRIEREEKDRESKRNIPKAEAFSGKVTSSVNAMN
jgi:hypothetical protein